MNKRRYAKICGIALSVILTASAVAAFPVTSQAAESGDAAGVSIPGTTGTGTSADPVICDTFSEFKAALEHKDTLHVSLHSTKEVFALNRDKYEPAITVAGTKYLRLSGNSEFTATAKGIEPLSEFIYVPPLASLTVNGNNKTDSLKYRACMNNGRNAVITNDGTLVVNGGKLEGSYNTAVYGRAIMQDSGELTINDGVFVCNSANDTYYRGVAACFIVNGKATINGGYFSTGGTSAESALIKYQESELKLCGGQFSGGISSSNDERISSWIGSGYQMLRVSDNTSVNTNVSAITEPVKIMKTDPLDDINCIISTPIIGGHPAMPEITTPHVKLNSVEIMDVETGVHLNFDYTYQRGHKYKVRLTLSHDEFVNKFADYPTVTYNSILKTTIESHTADKIVCSYVYEIPATVTKAILHITEPTAGAHPDFTVTKDDDACDFYSGLGLLVVNGTGLEFIDPTLDSSERWMQYMTKDDVFKAGQTYTARIYLTTINKTATYFDKSFYAYVNGKKATVSDTSDSKQTIITVDYTFTVPKNSGAVLRGDVNNDGTVNGADAGLLSRYASGWTGYADKIKNWNAADINGDGNVNGADAGILSRHVSGWTQYKKYFS